jgi:Mce-associated membrane protein
MRVLLQRAPDRAAEDRDHEDPVDEDPAHEDPDRGDPTGGRRWPVGELVLGGLVVLLAASSAVLWLGTRSADAAAARRADALAAARQEAVNLTSQDYRTVDADLRRMADGATGQLRADLEQRGADAKRVIVKNKAVARGVPVDAGLIAMNGDQAAAVVAVDSTVASTGATATTRRYRFQLDLTRVGDRWLVVNLTAVGLTA